MARLHGSDGCNAAGERIVSSITTTSAKALGLKGAKAYAMIKASNVMLAVD